MKYEEAHYFSNGITYVSDENKYYFINKINEVVSEKYDTIYGSSNFYFFKKNNLYGFLDSTAKVIEEPIFENIDSFYDGKISVKLNGYWMSWSKNKLNYKDEDLYFYRPELLPIYNEVCKNEDRKLEWRESCSQNQFLKELHITAP